MQVRWLLLLLVSTPAWAQRDPGIRSARFGAEPVLDGILVGGTLAVTLLVESEKFLADGTYPCLGERGPPDQSALDAYALLGDGDALCDATGMNALDRWAIGKTWAPALVLSDIGVLGMMALPFSYSGIRVAVEDEPSQAMAAESLIAAESLAITALLTSVLKTSVRRPRPLTYDPAFGKDERFKGDARLSFPSGHSALSFASASTFAVFALARSDSLATHLGVGGAFLGAGAVAYLRIAAGKHFPTDVLSGAALGTIVGLIVPLLHRLPEDPAIQNEALTYRPIFGLGGAF